MKQMIISKPLLIGLFALGLTACGGGGGGGGGGATSNSDEPAPTEPTTPAEPPVDARFDAANYRSDNVSNDSLAGLWMVLVDYQLRGIPNDPKTQQPSTTSGDYYESTGLARITVNIWDDSSGTINVMPCMPTASKRAIAVSVTNGQVLLPTSLGASAELTVVNNSELQGNLVSGNSDLTVIQSEVTAIKISDSDSVTGGGLGTLNIDIDDADSNQSTGYPTGPVHCFQQTEFEREFVLDGQAGNDGAEVVTLERLLNIPSELNDADSVFLIETIVTAGGADDALDISETRPTQTSNTTTIFKGNISAHDTSADTSDAFTGDATASGISYIAPLGEATTTFEADLSF